MLNLNNLKEITDGDPELLDQLIKTFIETTREDMQELKNAVKNRQSSLVAATAHRIKGGAAIVGATQLYSMAGDMERLGINELETNYDSLLLDMQNNFTAIENLYTGFWWCI
ncbi:hypothetical protein ACH42_05085 [Endozoicomonas sp. (ex Bugula neritina AB1)]|nr:hypothetical protein ACH42_05085 [Endozoicomonas sp. (ex Bugula neritina AB1)]